MKIIDGVKYYKIGEAAKLINKSPQTIKHWYEWVEYTGDKSKQLPKVYHLDNRGTRYFREQDIPALQKFGENIKYGEMSEFNSYLWGERGQLIRERGTHRWRK